MSNVSMKRARQERDSVSCLREDNARHASAHALRQTAITVIVRAGLFCKHMHLRAFGTFGAQFCSHRIECSTKLWYYCLVNCKHTRTLDAIFPNPPPANVNWSDIESLLVALGAEISEGSGSRIRIKLRGVRAVSHMQE